MSRVSSEREPAPRRLPLSRTYQNLRVLGLTGPAAGGKSFLLGIFREMGAAAIEADAVYKDLVLPGSPLLSRIDEAFPGVVTADGLDRAELSARVFGDPNDLLRLNAVVHPSLGDAVARAAGEGTASGNRRVVIEAAVLFEIGADGLCDEVWFVDCPPEERIRRLRAGRGWDEERARRVVVGQGGMAEIKRRCGRVVDGSAPKEALVQLAKEWISQP
ncbi:MAG: dephospho-CoA kinase [Armatimonadetes bacterium]|nr:dephospho-CoA kinase [Armatimonadota bacterium]NLN90716.1 dephospho-CoA kinase [candidate division WS1 bacterium]